MEKQGQPQRTTGMSGGTPSTGSTSRHANAKAEAKKPADPATRPQHAALDSQNTSRAAAQQAANRSLLTSASDEAEPILLDPTLVVAKPVPTPAAGVSNPAPVLLGPLDLEGHSETAEPLSEEERLEILESTKGRRFLLAAVPSWLVSLLVHLVLVVALALVTLDPVRNVISILQASASTTEASLEQFDLAGPTLEQSDALDQPVEMQTSETTDTLEFSEITAPTMQFTESINVANNSLTESVIPSSLLSSSSLGGLSASLNSRSGASRSELLERYGGTAASEESVALALKWLAAHQARDGGWTFQHELVCRGSCSDSGEMALARNGATAMALLPFLGAGQTHLEGQYKRQVYRGLEFLINNLKVTRAVDMPTGSWHEPGGRMYSHGLAAIAICEAYAMTQDPDLVQPAQLALNYLIKGQNSQVGGWRYSPGSPGDTSVVGWCLMALKSGKMGSLSVPYASLQKTDQFLDFVSTNQGAYYGYTQASAKKRSATTAVGLLCRMYLGYPKEHPGLQEGIAYLGETGPKLNDLYYSYYATQVMRHHGGDVWEKWNRQIRDPLIEKQEKKGHAAGSWYLKGSHSEQGGRLYTTSLATMILEVYYRHLPLYSEKSASDDFEI